MGRVTSRVYSIWFATNSICYSPNAHLAFLFVSTMRPRWILHYTANVLVVIPFSCVSDGTNEDAQVLDGSD
jgi:hypothetical protein